MIQGHYTIRTARGFVRSVPTFDPETGEAEGEVAFCELAGDAPPDDALRFMHPLSCWRTLRIHVGDPELAARVHEQRPAPNAFSVTRPAFKNAKLGTPPEGERIAARVKPKAPR